jgi:hypothetical protein
VAEITIQSVIAKLRIRPVRQDTWNIEDVGRELAKVSEMDTGDAINYIYKLFDIIAAAVTQGIHLKLGKLCIVGVECDVDGNVKPVIRPSPDLRAATRAYHGPFKYPENKGLDEEGFARRWLESHLDDTVIMWDGSSRTRADYGL